MVTVTSDPAESLLIPAINPRLTTLPLRFRTLRAPQYDAITRILEHFSSGKRVVVLDAPTGVGKTLIGEVVHRMIGGSSAFVCSGKELQAQFARDFHAPILMGRSNYRPTDAHLDYITCADCQLEGDDDYCPLCHDSALCPYIVARDEASRAPIAALNAHYWLNAVRSRNSPWSGRPVTIFDEADTLEQALMSCVEVSITKRFAEKWKIDPPRQMTKVDAWREWGLATLNRLREAAATLKLRDPLENAPEMRRVAELGQVVQAMVMDLDEEEAQWVYTGGAGSDRRDGDSISFRPVRVDRHGANAIWKYGDKFLLMSGTVISPGLLLSDLGWTEDYATVSIESPFPAKNRPVIIRPAQDMSRKAQHQYGIERMLSAVEKAVKEENGRVLIHAVSYSLSRSVADRLRTVMPSRPLFTYDNSTERSQAIADYKATAGAVLVAPSADRGIDLPDDFCRLQIICKVPFPNLGDQQVQARTYSTRDGKLWYQVQVARTVMQMVGRGVRHENDWCKCLILDANFESHWNAWKQLYPLWFRRAVRWEGM